MNKPQKIIECSIDALNGYNFPINELFYLIINIDENKYEFYINIRDDSDKLLILNSCDNDTYYENIQCFEESTIFYNELSANENNNGFETDFHIKSLESIASIIMKIAGNIFKYDQLKEYDNIIFFGSNFNGFVSLVLATLIRNSLAIVERPKLLTYNINESREYNLINLITKEKYIPNTYVLLDNKMDDSLIKTYNAVIKDLSDLPCFEGNTNNIKVLYNPNVNEYEPLKPYKLRKLLNNINKLNDRDYFDISNIHKKKILEQEKEVTKYENELKKQLNQITINNKEIAQNKKYLTISLNEFEDNNKRINEYLSQIDNLNRQLEDNDITIKNYQDKINHLNSKISSNNEKTREYKNKQEELLRKIKEEYSQEINNYKNELEHVNQILEHSDKIHADRKKYGKVTIDYYKLKGSLKKKCLLWIPYIYICFKSKNYKDISLNLKLYRTLNNNGWFNIGYYLIKHSDINRDKWCKYLTPELHYVIYGFDEHRKPNSMYHQHSSKKELLEYLTK